MKVSVSGLIHGCQAKVSRFVGAVPHSALVEALDLLDRAIREANERDRLHAERKTVLDEIACALHPRWPAGSRKTYAPAKLAGMIKALISERNAARGRVRELESIYE